MVSLADGHCVPCEKGAARFAAGEIANLATKIPDWRVVDGHHLARTFPFPDFRTALDFVNRAGAVAEEEGHHPDMLLAWGKVDVKVWTHVVGGLTENDFILAAKLDRAFSQK